MIKKYKTIIKLFLPPILAFALAVSLNIFAFTEPTAPPPGGNVSAPLNVSSTAQIKNGALTLGSLTITGNSEEPLLVGNNGYYFFVGANRAGGDYVDIGAYQSGIGWKNLILNRGGGNVGIGTTSPANKLHISGGDGSLALFGPNASWNGYLYVGAGVNQITTDRAQVISTNGNLHLDSASNRNTYINWYSGTNTFINGQGGNVGIGTTAPGQKLTIAGTAPIAEIRDGGYLMIRPVANTNDFRLTALDASGGDVVWGGAITTSIMRWANNGNVGIGTTAPGAKLDVANTSPAGWNYSVLAGNYSLNLGRSDGSGVGSIKLNAYTAGQYAFIRPSNGNLHIDSTTGQYYFNWDAGVYGLNSGIIHMANGSGAETVKLDSNGSSWLSGGNVGIGTTSPGYKLDVLGSIAAGNSDLYFTKTDHVHTGTGNTEGLAAIENASNYNALMILGRAVDADPFTAGYQCCNRRVRLWDYLQVNGGMDVTGNLGIGTTGPNNKLQVAGDISVDGDVNFSGPIDKFQDSPWYGLGFNNNTIDRWLAAGPIMQLGGYFGLQFAESGAVRMAIKSGNVGIGTTAPAYKLHVVGSFAAQYKNFEIPHPLDPTNKLLVHSSLEGPEHAVFYRGSAQLQNGEVIVRLPAYFEALTRKEGRTVQLTPIDGWSPLFVIGEIKDGAFVVATVPASNLSQKFYWEVKAVRADIPLLIPEKSR